MTAQATLSSHRKAGAHRTAVVGATTMIFSIIMALTKGLTENVNNLSLLHAPFVLGLVTAAP